MNYQSSKFPPSSHGSLKHDHSRQVGPEGPSKSQRMHCLSGTETDVSTSTENLSQEERYVIGHTARQEPQGEEKRESTDALNQHSGRQLSLDNASSYNTLIIHAIGEDGLEPWASLTPSRLSGLRDSYISAASSNSKTTSFPSSSAPSSPTLCGSAQSKTRDIHEIPDNYLSQSHVLKHLAKEMNVASAGDGSNYKGEDAAPRQLLLLDLSPDLVSHRYSTPSSHATATPYPETAKLPLSRSQPDLTSQQASENLEAQSSTAARALKTKLVWPAPEMLQLLVNENRFLKADLEVCYRKVAKSQKLEAEVSKIHRSHQELMQSSERREKLERAARQRLQEENRMLRQQYELLLAQTESPFSSVAGSSAEEIFLLKREIGKRDGMLAQLMAQNKELKGCRERQDIELAAQRATLQEQRTHIEILDTALTNAQANVVMLEEECRKRRMYEDSVMQLQQNLGPLQIARDKLKDEINELRFMRRVDNEAHAATLKQDSNMNSGAEQPGMVDVVAKIKERDERLAAMEGEVIRWHQWYLEENAMRQAAIEAVSIPKDAKIAALEKTSQESERLMAEAQTDKIRQLDELHAARRKLVSVEGRCREMESKLAEKDAMIRVLQHHSIASSGSVLSRASPQHHFQASCSSNSYHKQQNSFPASITPPSTPMNSKTSTRLQSELCGASSSSTTLNSLPRGLSNLRGSDSGLSPLLAGYGLLSSPLSKMSVSPLPNSTKTTSGNSSISQSYSEEAKNLDDQMKGIDSQILGGTHQQRVLCCFSGLYNRGVAARKEGLPQPLLVGMKRRPKHDCRFRSASPGTEGRRSGGSSSSLPPTPPPGGCGGLPPTPPEASRCTREMLLLEKQGRASQKQRRSSAGSQLSSDDLGSSQCLLSRPTSRHRAPSPAGGIGDKINFFQQSNHTLKKATSKDSLTSGVKYRIQL